MIEGCDDEARLVVDAAGICMTFPSGDQGPCTGEYPTRYYCAPASSHEYAPNLNANCKDIGGGEYCCVEPYVFEPKPAPKP